MKKLILLFLTVMLGMGAFAQTTYSWSGAIDGNWNKAGNWSGNAVPNGGSILSFGNDNQLTMTNNLPATTFHQIIFTNAATQSRIITGTKENIFYDYSGKKPKIENNSSANQTIDFPLKWGNSVMELNPVLGDLTFTKAINNNGIWTDVWGGNGKTLSIASMSGTGGLTIKNNPTTVKITGTSTYTGKTYVNFGTLELQADLSSEEIIVANEAKLIINGNDVDVEKLTINSGGTVEVKAGKSLTVKGALNNSGTLNLLSDANGTATIKTLGTVTNGGTTNYKVEQYLALPRRTWYMSSPVSGTVTPGGGVTNIKSYDETTGLWSSAGTTMIAKTGYLLYPSSTSTTEATTMTFNGTLNNGNIDIPLTRTSGKGNGFNLIGNPYPSHIVWTTDMATSAKLLTSIWYRTAVYNSSTSKNVYSFHTYNAAGTVASPVEATQYIPPMQAFWVRVDATSDGTETLTLTNSMRHHKSSNPLKAPAVKTTENQILRLQVAAGNITDEAVIYSNENASIGFDTYDSPKFMNDDTSIPEIYTTVGNEKLVINGMNSIPLDTEIGLGFVPGDATSFSIKANEISNLPADVKVILKDYGNNGLETDLTDGVTAYEFAPATTTGNRFSVIFRSAGALTAVDTKTSNSISVYSNQNGIHVTVNSTPDENASVRVFNAVGQQLVNQRLTNRTTTVNGNFKPGVYVVKVSNGTAANSTQKIVIK